MTQAEIGAALTILQAAQQQTASITVQIGGTFENNQVEHNVLYVLDAPSAAMTKLIQAGYSLSVHAGQIHSSDNRKPFIKQRLLALAGIPRGKVTEIKHEVKRGVVSGSVLRRDNGGWIRMGRFEFQASEMPALQTA